MIFNQYKDEFNDRKKSILDALINKFKANGISYHCFDEDKEIFLSGEYNPEYGDLCLPIYIDGNRNKAIKIANELLKDYNARVEKDLNNSILLILNNDIELELPSMSRDIHEILDSTPNDRIFITTDWHIGADHYGKGKNKVNIQNIVKWCKDHINPNDVFIYLGDLAYRYSNKEDQSKAQEIYKSLPGIKVLILGNHDIPLGPQFYTNCGFDFIFKALRHNDIIFSHRPVDLGNYADAIVKTNIHGHKHEDMIYNVTDGKDSINCYPSLFDNKPVTLDYLLKNKDKLVKNHEHDYWSHYTESTSEFGERNDIMIMNDDNRLEDIDISNIKHWLVHERRYPEDIAIDDYKDSLEVAIDGHSGDRYVFICNNDADSLEPICVGQISISEDNEYKWIIKYPVVSTYGNYYSLMKQDEYCTPVVGINNPHLIKTRETEDSIPVYAFSPNIFSNKYFVINEDSKLELIDADKIKDWRIESQYKFIGDMNRIKKIYEAYDDSKFVDNTAFYTILTGSPMLSEDQLDFDNNFEKCLFGLEETVIKSKVATVIYEYANISNLEDNSGISLSDGIKYNLEGYYYQDKSGKRTDYVDSYINALRAKQILTEAGEI